MFFAFLAPLLGALVAMIFASPQIRPKHVNVDPVTALREGTPTLEGRQAALLLQTGGLVSVRPLRAARACLAS